MSNLLQNIALYIQSFRAQKNRDPENIRKYNIIRLCMKFLRLCETS